MLEHKPPPLLGEFPSTLKGSQGSGRRKSSSYRNAEGWSSHFGESSQNEWSNRINKRTSTTGKTVVHE